MKPTLISPTQLLILAIGLPAFGYALGRVGTPPPPPPSAPAVHPEVARLQAAYGPTHHSQGVEEWIVRDYFHDKRDGVFLDVGAFDYQRLSNTYQLEAVLGWSGLAIEPQRQFAPDYARYRPRTTLVSVFASDRSDEHITLHVPKGRENVASSKKEFTESYARSSPMEVPTATLDDILAAHQIGSIDFLSMDIELAEPAALRGFSIDQHRPALVCIEAHEEVRQEILDYFTAHGYTLLTRYLNIDTGNFWFAPAGSRAPV